MKMWKVAVAAMLLASSAFGAVSLEVTPDSASSPGVYTINLNITGGEQVAGVSIFALTGDNQVRVSSRSLLNATLSDPTDTLAVGKLLDSVGSFDLGVTGAAGTSVNTSSPLMDLGLELLPGVDSAQIDIYGSIAFLGGGAADVGPYTVSLVPEPASMSLLAIGAAFFARRRRA